MSRGAAAVAPARDERDDRPLPPKLKKIGYAALPLAHLAKVSCRLTAPARDILEWIYKHSTGIGPRRNEWVPLNLDRIASDTGNSKNTICTHLQLLGVTPDRRRAAEKCGNSDEKAKLLNGWTELVEMRRVGRLIEGKIDYDAYARLERPIDEHKGEGEDPVKAMVKRFVRTAVDVNFGKKPELLKSERTAAPPPVAGYSFCGKPVAADSMSIEVDAATGVVVISVDGEQAISFPAEALRRRINSEGNFSNDFVAFQQLKGGNVPGRCDILSPFFRPAEEVAGSDENASVDGPLHAELQAKLTPEAFANWVAPARFSLTAENAAVTVTAPNEYAADWLRQDYAPLIAEACERVVGRPVPLRFAVKSVEGAGAGGETEPRAAPESRPLQSFTLTDYTRFLHQALVDEGIEDRVRRAVPLDLIWTQAARMFVPPSTFLEALHTRKGRFKDWGFLRFVVDDAINMNVVAAKQGARAAPL